MINVAPSRKTIDEALARLTPEYIEQVQHNLTHPRRGVPDYQVSAMYSNRRILGLMADTSACGYYRIFLPLQLLKMHGAYTEARSVCGPADIRLFDDIIAPRQHNQEIGELLNLAIWEGRKVWYELDDDLDHISTMSPAYPVYHMGTESLSNINKVMTSCLGLTVSTPPLAKWYSRQMSNVAVIDNYIDFSIRDWSVDVEWTPTGPLFHPKPIKRPERWGDKIVIGYSCGNTHQEDWLEHGKSIAAVLRKYPQVLFVLYSSPQVQRDFSIIADLPMDQVEFQSAAHFLDHPEGLQGMDIQIAPLACNQFNLCKTALKAYESFAAGAAFVGSKVGPYAHLHKRAGGDKLVLVGKGAHAYSSWMEALSYLIENHEERKAMANRAREWVIANQSMEANFHVWPASWDAMWNRVTSGIVGKPKNIKSPKEYMSYGAYDRSDNCPVDPSTTYKKGYFPAYG